MPNFERIVEALRQQMSSNLSRSDAMKPLYLIISLSALTLLGCLHEMAPVWLLISVAALLSLTIFVAMGVYVFFAVKNPTALRSEKYAFVELAIIHNLVGDDTTGLIEIEAERIDVKPSRVRGPSKTPLEHRP